ncbi:endonuclease MutS2 [Alicyclobacillus sp. SP_1]|uniref:endonuclease MutS2 n=1 Tax=Alicyclobacillus sp. SP_1 TaxID=2942475 RepID=UPI002156F721|nr:endonuclease MutS2 [Alicyclobacillus sp. SP_1]
MHERALGTLEFDKVRERMARYVACSLGRERMMSVAPFVSLAEAREELSAVDEALTATLRYGTAPFGGITDIRGSVQRARIGGLLSVEQLSAVAAWLAGIRALRQYVTRLPDSSLYPHLVAVVESLFPGRDLERAIREVIAEDGTILDRASPELQRLRQERRTVEARARKLLEQMLRTESQRLQEPVIALRGNALCLPVKVEYKNSFPGVIRDYSASGSTVYIEPRAVVEQGEMARELLLREEREIERLLLLLSQQVGACAEWLEVDVESVSMLDLWFAKAAYAKAEGCELPVLRDDAGWQLRRARHPLLAKENAVPLDVEMGENYRMLMITGPNTGGKTVTLKTVGLLTVMAMSGCFIPAERGSSVAWCEDIHADIGDEQSIEQSLSTFSSHLRNIVDMLRHVRRGHLVLLDELGAGTDPGEGAALAIAILEKLAAVGAYVVATTHYAELKAYAFREPLAMNASMEFDIQSLSPTYRLLIGVPGRSNAFAIARRLGLPEDILARAEANVSTEDRRLEAMIAEIEEARRRQEKALTAAELSLASAARMERELSEAQETFDRKAEERLQASIRQADEILRKARETAETVIAELREKQSSLKDHELVELKKMLAPVPRSDLGKSATRKQGGSSGGLRVQVGSQVKVHSLGQKGEVLEVSGDKVMVQLGVLRTKVDLADVEVLSNKEPLTSTSRVRGSGLDKTVRMELDVRGETVEDALQRIDKYLDDAVLSGLSRLVIIHGKGTGALRDGIRYHLARHPQVKSREPGGLGEGGDGVTVVQVRS